MPGKRSGAFQKSDGMRENSSVNVAPLLACGVVPPRDAWLAIGDRDARQGRRSIHGALNSPERSGVCCPAQLSRVLYFGKKLVSLYSSIGLAGVPAGAFAVKERRE